MSSKGNDSLVFMSNVPKQHVILQPKYNLKNVY